MREFIGLLIEDPKAALQGAAMLFIFWGIVLLTAFLVYSGIMLILAFPAVCITFLVLKFVF